jgi:hypothetical protein
MKTCENCGWRHVVVQPASACWDCLEEGRPKYSCWRPRRWPVVLICAAIGLALTVAACVVWACLDQERINAIPRAEARVRDFQFYEKTPVRIEDRMTWKRGETVVWTVYSVVGPGDGYAISKGE